MSSSELLICFNAEGQQRQSQQALGFFCSVKYSLHLHLPPRLATNLSRSSAVPSFLSKAVLCHWSFCFAPRLRELSLCLHPFKPVRISCAPCSPACTQMTSPSLPACTHFLVSLRFGFTPALFIFNSQNFSVGAAWSKSSWEFPAQRLRLGKHGLISFHFPFHWAAPFLWIFLHILSLTSRTNNQTAKFCPCSWQRDLIFKVPSNPNCSLIPFYHSKFLNPSMPYPHGKWILAENTSPLGWTLSEDSSLCTTPTAFPAPQKCSLSLFFLSIMDTSFGFSPRSSDDYGSVCKVGNKPWSQEDVIKLAKLQMKVATVIMGCRAWFIRKD